MKKIKNSLFDAAWIIALLSLLFGGYKYYESVKASKIADWQRVVVFSAINRTNGLSYKEIKSSYLEAALQLDSFDLPKSEIQNGALQRILLNLLREKVVGLDLDNKYKVIKFRMPQSESEVDKLALQLLERKQEIAEKAYKYRGLFYSVTTKVLKDQNQYTIASLYQEVKEEGINIEYEDFFVYIQKLINSNYLSETNDKLFVIKPNNQIQPTAKAAAD